MIRRKLQVDFECIVTGANDDEASDNLDVLSEQVEEAIATDLFLNSLVEDMNLISSGDVEGTSEGRVLAFASTLTYQVNYISQHPRNEDLPRLVDFETAHADYSSLASDTVEVRNP